MPTVSNSTTRFGDRVENYVKYRPHYPSEIIPYLRDEIGLAPNWVVADIGSGTGFSAELFLENGNYVFCIEPNQPMRQAGDEYLSMHFTNFRSLEATAEETTLPPASIDLAIAGQAFHWFDIEKARAEAIRILRPGGYAAIIWNERLTTGSRFLELYEQLLKDFGTDYATIDHRNVTDANLADFFGGKNPVMDSIVGAEPYIPKIFDNSQTFGYEGIEGRLLSSSYVPSIGEPNYDAMLGRLREIFDETSEDGKATFLYRTEVYLGRLSG